VGEFICNVSTIIGKYIYVKIYIINLLCYLIECNTFRLSERLTEITNAIDRTPPKKYIEAVTNLMSFINNVEGFLLSEHIIMSDQKIMEEQIKRLKNIQSSLKEQEEIFRYVNSTGQDLIAKISDDSSGQRLKDGYSYHFGRETTGSYQR